LNNDNKLAIIGCGNIGTAIARGLVASQNYNPGRIILTRRKIHLLDPMKDQGYLISEDNRDAISRAKHVLFAVEPRQLKGVLEEVADVLDPANHKIFSVVSGADISEIKKILNIKIPVVRIMPNLAVAIGESMTCMCAEPDDQMVLNEAREIFDHVGKTVIIEEELMVPATALCACGIAFFFRAIRAASQGGIEIGFQSLESLEMAAQTAKGAAALLNSHQNHPETEIDRVTTPRGCTIAGLNNMEHEGFSSAMIRGIITSAEKAEKLFRQNGNNSRREY
jgi:pyrroline-5-carboxylate reductase